MPQTFRDLVFVSYSHRDAAWLEPVRTLLKPFMRDGVLKVFVDPYIQAGELWERRIEHALDSAGVGLLLISSDFYASDFIMTKELPPLLRAAEEGLLTLLCVPVRPSTYQSPELARYQWVHPPDRPLSLLAEAEREKALAAVVRAVVDAAGARGGDHDPTPPAADGADDAEEVGEPVVPAAVAPAGSLHGVPSLPLHYLPRPEALEKLKEALFRRRRVVITGRAVRLGVHGPGGIGKTVVATALAHDPEVRRAFPDGVFWVDLGQEPDVPRLQARLVRAAGGDPADATTVEEGREALGQMLRERACLVVLDDAWDIRHVRAFDVAGGRARLLVTTRDGAVLTALGASEVVVGQLPRDRAVALLASWAGQDPSRLPTAGHDVARACGFLPLALTVAGALVRDGVLWGDLAEALRRGELEFLDHPHGSVFRSLRVSVDALPPTVRRRYLELAVIPEDARVPESVVLTLWNGTGGVEPHAARALLSRLRRLALLEWTAERRLSRARRNALRGWRGRRARLRERTVALHDLQQDFLRIVVDDLPALHRMLVDAMARSLPRRGAESGWHDLPRGVPYFWTRLAGHLVAGGRLAELRALLLDGRWLAAKLRVSGLAGLLSDFEWFAGDPELDQLARTLRLSAHILADRPGQLPAQLLGRLSGTDSPGLRALLEGLPRIAGLRPWLRPLTATLGASGIGLLRTIHAHSDAVVSAGFDRDRLELASASRDGTARLWDLETGRELRGRLGREYGSVLAMSRDGSQLALGNDYGTVKVLSSYTGRILASFNVVDEVQALAFRGDERVFVATRFEVSAWAFGRREPLWSLEEDFGRTRALRLSTDGRRLVTGSPRGRVYVRDTASGEVLESLGRHASGVTAVAFGAGEGAVVSASLDGTLKLWDLEGRREPKTLGGQKGRVLALEITHEWAISGGEDGRIRFWELSTGRELHSVRAHENAVTTLAVGMSGRRMASGADDGTVKVWDLDAMREAEGREAAEAPVLCLAISPDGRFALSGAEDGALRLWDVAIGRELHVRRSRVSAVHQVVFEDGEKAASMADDGQVTYWRVRGSRLVRIRHRPVRRSFLDDHESPTARELHKAELPGGYEVTADPLDGEVRLWDGCGRELARFTADSRMRCCLAAPDGGTVLTVDEKGRIHFLRLENVAGLLVAGEPSRERVLSRRLPPQGPSRFPPRDPEDFESSLRAFE